jgi:CRP-like cAMP-binding protein
MEEKKGLAGVIATVPLFQGLPARYLELAAGCASNAVFREGEMIFREGDAADRFYAVRQGRVSVEVFVPQRGAVTIQTAGPGDVLSWSWLFPPYVSRFDARCLTLTRALAFDGACLRGKCEEDHELGYEFMKRFAQIMVERLRATRLQLLDVYGNATDD